MTKRNLALLCIVGGASVAAGAGTAAAVCTTTSRGSDTLFTLLEKAYQNLGLTNKYTGGGSTTGENATFRPNTGSPIFNDPQQTLAPMSRSVKLSLLHKGGHKAKQYTIAADGVAVIVPPVLPLCSFTVAEVRTIFSGADGKGTSTSCGASTRSSLLFGDIPARCQALSGLAGGTVGHALRRDDVSGTTDVFKTKIAITQFCNGASPEVGASQDNDPIKTDAVPELGGQTGFVLGVQPNPTTLEPATSIINRLVKSRQSDKDRLGFVGLSGGSGAFTAAISDPSLMPPKPPIQPTDVSIRQNSYAVARALFLNQLLSATACATLDETQLLPELTLCSDRQRANVRDRGFFNCMGGTTATPSFSGPGTDPGACPNTPSNNICFIALQDSQLDPDCAREGEACSSTRRCCAARTGTDTVCSNPAGGTCAAPVAQGGACRENQQCASGRCSTDCVGNDTQCPTPGTCLAKLGFGQPCSLDLHCEAPLTCVINCPTNASGCEKGLCQ
jgi:ABC-type phosphate transport system substrate-binding protein